MNKIDKCFSELSEKGQKAFIPYITAGDPDLAMTEKIALKLADSGADIIEIGIPFSDPLADGPTIQKAIKRSLDSGTTPAKTLTMVRSLRKKTDIPIVFMTYSNIIFNYGMERFLRDSALSGADGIVVPDLPLEESVELSRFSTEKDVDMVLLASPTSPLEKIEKIAGASSGFLYYVSVSGVTGSRRELAGKLRSRVERIKNITDKPVCVGFGISTYEQAKEVSEFADGVIVGSSIIKFIEKNTSRRKMLSDIADFAGGMSAAVHGV